MIPTTPQKQKGHLKLNDLLYLLQNVEILFVLLRSLKNNISINQIKTKLKQGAALNIKSTEKPTMVAS
jgi:thiamine pyrophosphokinase